MASSSGSKQSAPSGTFESSIFQKPSFVKKQSVASKPTGADYFNRKTLTLAEVSAENERRRQERQALKLKQRRSQSESEDSPNGKRRRLNSNTPNPESAIADSDSSTDSDSDKEEPSFRQSISPSKGKEPRNRDRKSDSRRLSTPSPLPKLTVASASKKRESNKQQDDESDSAQSERATARPRTPPKRKPRTAVESSEEDADEDFPELVRRAKERARLKRMEEESRTKGSSISPLRARGEQLSISNNAAPTLSPAKEDPTLKIYITSPLEGTKPIVMVRRLMQPLSHVKKAWCDRHKDLSEEEMESIILTWRGIRLYEVTTCKSLGLDFDEHGEFLYKGKYYHSGSDRHHIELEALPLAMHEGKIPRPSATAAEDKALKTEAPPPEKEKEQTVRLILTAKDYEEFGIMVKKSTPIFKMLRAFRKATPGLPPDKELYINFEGEDLGGEETPEGLDLEDLDKLEVYLK